jgi:MinD-like ATPase involved in chromosome partitioning or flagellar assembly
MKKKIKPAFESETKVTTFWGTGASGCTTLSLEYCRQLAEAGRKTLLIDHDLLDPSLMVYLAIDNHPSGLQAGLRLASQQRLDPTNLNELIIESRDFANLSFMAGLPTVGRFRSIEAESITALVELLRTWFDEIVIDLGCLIPQEINPQAFSLQQQLFTCTDEIFGVFRADPEGIAKLFWLPIQGELIANNYRAGSLGAGGKKGLKSIIAEITGKSLVAIGEEDDHLIQAVAKGIPVGEVSKKSPVSQLVRAMIQNRLDASG